VTSLPPPPQAQNPVWSRASTRVPLCGTSHPSISSPEDALRVEQPFITLGGASARSTLVCCLHAGVVQASVSTSVCCPRNAEISWGEN
jgi:hypothetical protein